MSRFFIDRPIFAWVIAIVIMLARRAGDHARCRSRSTRRSRRPRSRITRDLSRARRPRRVRGHGDPGHRAADERHRRPAVHVVDSRLDRAARPITLTFASGHRSRHRAGAGAEQAAAGDAAAAAGGAAAGRDGRQGDQRLPDGRRLRLEGRQHERATTSPTTSPATLQDPLSRVARRRRRCSCSARSTRCASGSIRTSSPTTS